MSFVSQLIQGLSRFGGLIGSFIVHTHPQSSEQIKRANQTLRETLTNLTLETGECWMALLPLTLLRVGNTPCTQEQTPHEIMFGRSPPLCLKSDLRF